MNAAQQRVGIVGSGLIGRAWAVAFARGGCTVRLFDPEDDVAQRALGLIAETLEGMAQVDLLHGQKAAEVSSRIAAVSTLAEAVSDAHYVQENSP